MKSFTLFLLSFLLLFSGATYGNSANNHSVPSLPATVNLVNPRAHSREYHRALKEKHNQKIRWGLRALYYGALVTSLGVLAYTTYKYHSSIRTHRDLSSKYNHFCITPTGEGLYFNDPSNDPRSLKELYTVDLIQTELRNTKIHVVNKPKNISSPMAASGTDIIFVDPNSTLTDAEKRAIAWHELSHLQNHDCSTRLICEISTLISLIGINAAWDFYLNRKNLSMKNRLWECISRAFLTYYLFLGITSSYSRHLERKADENIPSTIEHLTTMRNLFTARAQKHESSLSWDSKIYNRVFSTHPFHSERAARFDQRLQTLKQKNN